MAGHTAINYFGEIYLLGGWNGNYKSTVTRYFGASIPKNIVIKTKNNALMVSWNGVFGATGYKVEIDNEIYTTASNSYTLTNCEDIEHKIRVCAVNGTKQSLWSDYEYHYSNSTLIDAKTILPNSTNSDKLYKTGQVRWYKMNNDQAGNLSVSLTNVASNCHYLLQLCGSNGEVISSGVEQNEYSIIDNVVLSPYPYYLKITSIYGGNSDMAYNLNCSFVPADEEVMPDRIKSTFLKPSSLDDLSTNSGMIDLAYYEGVDEPPVNVVATESNETANINGSGSAVGIEELTDEEFIDDNENEHLPSLMSVQNSNEETGVIANQGNYINKSVTVPSNLIMSSLEKLKLVVLIIPDNNSDIFKLEWTGSNTNYSNFWWHCHGDNEYYLTALLSRTSRGTAYSYRVTYNYKSTGSNGGYTIKTYMIVDNNTAEDFNSTAGNDNSSTADSVSVSTNSFATCIGKLDHEYDWDSYIVSVSNNQKLAAYIVSPENKWYSVNIVDHTGNSTSYTSSQYMDGHIGEYGEAYASIKTTSSRNYIIIVRPFTDGISADSTYTLKIFKYNISVLGDMELNDTTEQADVFALSLSNNYIGTTNNTASAINFKIDYPADIDYYPVSMLAGEVFKWICHRLIMILFISTELVFKIQIGCIRIIILIVLIQNMLHT